MKYPKSYSQTYPGIVIFKNHNLKNYMTTNHHESFSQVDSELRSNMCHLPLHLFNKCFLNTYYVPNAGDTAVSNTHETSTFMEFIFYWKGDRQSAHRKLK
jgi:hypothetical protein